MTPNGVEHRAAVYPAIRLDIRDDALDDKPESALPVLPQPLVLASVTLARCWRAKYAEVTAKVDNRASDHEPAGVASLAMTRGIHDCVASFWSR